MEEELEQLEDLEKNVNEEELEETKEVVVKEEETSQDEEIISEGVEEAATKMVGRNSRSFYCKKCGKEFRSRIVTMRHAEVHLNIRVTCSVCGVNAVTRNALSAHYHNKHNMSVNFRNV